MMLTAAADPAVKEIDVVDLTQDVPTPPEIINIETYVCNMVRENLTRIKAEPGLQEVPRAQQPAGSGRQQAAETLKV